MPYSINRFNGDLLVTINDGTIDTASTSLRLLGKGATNYGELSAENYVHIVENFFRDLPPPNPLIGQLWYQQDANGPGNHKLNVNRNNDPENPDWVVLNGVAVNIDPLNDRGKNPVNFPGIIGPPSPQGGEMHWDGDQLRIFNELEKDNPDLKKVWPLLGPLAPPSANTISEWERVSNGVGEPRELIKFIVNDKLVAIFSDSDAPFPPTQLAGQPDIDPRLASDFPTVSGGININPQFVSSDPFVPLNASSEPSGDNIFNIGSSAKRWKNIHTVIINATQINTGNPSPGDWFGNIDIELLLRKDIDLIPSVDNDQVIGRSTDRWKEIYVNSIHAVEINDIPIDNFARRDIDILPTVTLTNDIGSSSAVWKDAFIQEIHIDNIFLGTGSPSAVNVLNIARRDDDNVPTNDNTFNLGSAVRKWKDIHATTIDVDNITTIQMNSISINDFMQLDRVEAFTKQKYFDAATLVSSGGAVSWDLDQAQVAVLTLTEPTTINNPTPTRIKPGATYKLIVKQDGGGGKVLSFGSVFKWPGSVAPIITAASNAVDTITFISDGTNLYGTFEHTQNFG